VQFADDASILIHGNAILVELDTSVVSWFNVNDRKINVEEHELFILVLEMISNIQA
jgi:hypothetical protein